MDHQLHRVHMHAAGRHIILIGATTENPFFAVNSALVSRSQIFQFQAITPDDIKQLLKRAIADERITRLSEAVPDEVQHRASALRQQLRDLGWHPPSEDEGFAAGQPRFVFQLPLEGETPASLLAGIRGQAAPDPS